MIFLFSWNLLIADARLRDSVGIRDMRQKAKDSERYANSMQMTIKGIEQAAARAFEKDKAEQGVNRYQKNWVLHEESGYYYNSLYGWYYDAKSKMYYGGNPPDWTHKPNIPSAGYYGAVNPQSDPLLQAVTHNDIKEEHAQKNTYPVGFKVQKVHPLADIGGYQMPLEGSFGSGHARTEPVQEAKKQEKGKKMIKASSGVAKKKSSEGKGKETALSAKEREFLAKREAARQRVQKRTMDQFGLS